MNNKRKHRKLRKPVKVLLSFLLIFTVSVGGTIAYLSTQTGPVVNTFMPSHVDCEVEEKFDGVVKKNVNVTNTSDIDAYIRVKLITYRVNKAGDHIGGTSEVPAFTLGTNWVKHTDGFYYYTLPVLAGQKPEADLIGDEGIELKSYDDADGGKQVIEVMAEAIQANPADAVGQTWGVTITLNSVTPYKTGGNN